MPNYSTEIFAKAIDVLNERGWAQGDYMVDDAVCVMGAVGLAAGIAPHHLARDLWLEDLCEPLNRALGRFAAKWNDEEERTEADVKILLKFAAADELDTYRSLYTLQEGAQP